MTLALTSDQQDLATAVAGFTSRHAEVSVTRDAFQALARGDRQPSWEALITHGFHGVHLPEWAGGDGATLAELAVVLEQAACGLFPGPLLPTVLASQLIAEHAPESLARELLPRLVAGATAAAALTAHGLRATPTAGGWRVTGQTAPVLGAAGAQILILAARADRADQADAADATAEAETVWFAVDSASDLEVTPAEPVDLTRDVGRVALTGCHVTHDQVLAVTTTKVQSLAAALAAAEAAGVARWCQRSGVAYAKVREQFGKPIGSFQAVKHKCARLFARTELLTAAAWDAAVAHGQGDEQFALAAAAAAIQAAQATDIALETVTLFGGIGYTWEHDAHLYWRRAMSLASLLGPRGGWERKLTRRAIKTERSHDLRPADEPAGLRDWAARTLAEAARLEPARQRRFLAERGLAAPHYPKPYGIDAKPVAQVVIAQEFARAGVIQPATTIGEWALPTILAHGTAEQRAAFVFPTLLGDIKWCQLFSEPGAGSDLASLRTKATQTDGGWLLTGQKVWTSQARQADWAICLARTDPAAPKHAGISYFLVDMRSPGLEVRPLREANGGYMFNEVFLTDVFVPDGRLVGDPGEGWKLARTTLGNERVTIAGGMGRRDLPTDHLPAYDSGDFPAEIEAECGALTADALAFTAMSQRLLLRQLGGLRPGAEASVLKVIHSWNAANLRRAALDWHGPQALAHQGALTATQEDHELGGLPAGPAQEYLTLPPLLIGGGTLEIQLNVIAEQVLGLPR